MRSRRSQLQQIVGHQTPPEEDVEMKTPSLYAFSELTQAGITVVEELDHGTYARVYKATVSDEDVYGTSTVAVKRQYIQIHTNKYEIEILHELGWSRYIPELLDIVDDRENRVYSLVLPYYEHVSFRECMASMALKEFQEYARHLFLSLDELHKHGYVHRDVKPGNFLYVRGRTPEENQYVLLDFGLAEKITHLAEAQTKYGHLKTRSIRTARRALKDSNGQFVKPILDYADDKAQRQGTKGFRPPEVLMSSHFQNETLDVWSAGVILAAIVTGVYALFGAPEDDTKALWNLSMIFGECALVNAATDLKGNLDFWTNPTVQPFYEADGLENYMRKLCIKEEYSNCRELFDMFADIFQLTPMRRPTAEQILRHRFFRLRL